MNPYFRKWQKREVKNKMKKSGIYKFVISFNVIF